jgi:hypothetical protein
MNSIDAIAGRNQRNTQQPGNYFVFSTSGQAVNISRTKGVAGSWINGTLNIAPTPIQAPPVTQPQATVKFPISENNLRAMIDLGIINSPDYWRNVNIQWLNELMANVAKNGVCDKRINNGINDVGIALKTLVDAKVINTPNYWQDLVDRNIDRFLGTLIINMANKCRDILEQY